MRTVVKLKLHRILHKYPALERKRGGQRGITLAFRELTKRLLEDARLSECPIFSVTQGKQRASPLSGHSSFLQLARKVVACASEREEQRSSVPTSSSVTSPPGTAVEDMSIMLNAPAWRRRAGSQLHSPISHSRELATSMEIEPVQTSCTMLPAGWHETARNKPHFFFRRSGTRVLALCCLFSQGEPRQRQNVACRCLAYSYKKL